jgi:hypothetical protein
MEIEFVRLQEAKSHKKWQSVGHKVPIWFLLENVMSFIFGSKSVCVLVVCARRTTLKSGSLHFAAEAEGPSSSSKVAMKELCGPAS